MAAQQPIQQPMIKQASRNQGCTRPDRDKSSEPCSPSVPVLLLKERKDPDFSFKELGPTLTARGRGSAGIQQGTHVQEPDQLYSLISCLLLGGKETRPRPPYLHF